MMILSETNDITLTVILSGPYTLNAKFQSIRQMSNQVAMKVFIAQIGFGSAQST